MQKIQGQVVGFALVCWALLAATSALAAAPQKVSQSDWWAGATGLPTYVNMYLYVPDRPATKPPIVVAPHHCQGTGLGTYSEMASLISIANSTGFILIFPEATGQNCWDAGSLRSLKHGGGGDTGAIVQMVKYVVSKYSADADRVYSVGGSSGGIMTEALLGVYPDVFMGGVSLMGVPCGCWAQGYNDIQGSGGTAQWSGACAGGDVKKTGPQWADLVASYFPGYTAHRPRLQHWHGTADTTLNYKNLAEDIKEWTSLLGLAESPTGSDMPKSGTTHQFWKNACGFTVYETFSLSGVGHMVPFDGNAVAAYFGLGSAGAPDPETAACPGAVPGGTGKGGGAGGSGMGGRGGSGGQGAGGTAGTAASTGGAGGTGMTGGSGSGMAGNEATGGRGAAGSAGSGAHATGGEGTGGSAGRNGQGGMSAATGGQGGQGETPPEPPGSGCDCGVASSASGTEGSTAFSLLLVALALRLRRASPRTGRRPHLRPLEP